MKPIPARFSDFKGLTHAAPPYNAPFADSNILPFFLLCVSVVMVGVTIYSIHQNNVINASIIVLKKDVATLSSLNNKPKTEKDESTVSES